MLLKKLIRRFIYSAVVLFLLITLLFFLIRLAPGNPSDKFISPKFSKELKVLTGQKYGINEPLYIQYVKFVSNMAHGDMGTSYNYHQPVEEVILRYLPFTVTYASLSLLIQLLISLFLARWISKRLGGITDKLFSNGSLMVYALPAFFTGVILLYIFSVRLKILPSSGASSFNIESMSFAEKIIDMAYHMILPVITLSAAGTAMFYKYLRDEIEITLKQPFVTYLRSNGFDESIIINKHVIPNAAGPLISVAGVEYGVLLSGAVITEVIFGLPGMGRLTLDAVLTRDYPLIIGCTITSGVMVIITNLAADVVRGWLDPRQLKDGVLG